MTSKFRLLFVLSALLIFAFGQAAHAIPDGCPDEGAIPLNIGPVNPQNGFPLWVQDSTGLAVELCNDINSAANPTGVCIGDPVDPGNPFSVQIGFGAEGFMASAETSIDTGQLSALLVTGVELAFLTEVPADGDQFPFTRLRIRVDVPAPGIYTVTHPWGREVFIVEAVGAGQEVRESFDIEFAADTMHQGRIGPILTWDTFNRTTGTLSDSPLVGFIGDLGTPHTVTGSPCETNYFSIEAVGLDGTTPIEIDGAGGNVVTETEFAVTGKVFTGVAPTPLVANRTTYARQSTGNGQVDIFATSTSTAGVTFSGGANLPTGERPLIGDGNSAFFASLPLPDASNLPMTVNVTATNTGNSPTTIISILTDMVNITRAEYDADTGDLTIEATSSDELAPSPTLTAFGFGNLAAGSLTVNTPAPPATVTVISTAGGSDTESVTIAARAAVGDPPVAIPDAYSVAEDGSLTTIAGDLTFPGVLDTDTDDVIPAILEAVLGANVANGILDLGLDGGFTYTPNPNFTGVDIFTYAARDSDGNFSSPATVTITVGAVNDPPVANDDPATTNVNTPVVIFVLANDTDVDGTIDPATVVATTPTAGGGTTISNIAGEVIYTPALDFTGADTFTYTVQDDLGATSLPATVTVTVADVVAEVITVQRAQFRAGRNEWRVDGTTTVPGPGNFMDVHVGDTIQGALVGTVEVDALGNWDLRPGDPDTLPDGATTVTVHSTGGSIVTVPLQVR